MFKHVNEKSFVGKLHISIFSTLHEFEVHTEYLALNAIFLNKAQRALMYTNHGEGM